MAVRVPVSEAKRAILREHGIEDDFQKKLGGRIRTLRENRKFSRSALAEKIGCSDLTLERIESGRIPLMLYDLLLLSKALDTSIEEILPLCLNIVKTASSVEMLAGEILAGLDAEEGKLVQGLVLAMALDAENLRRCR